MYLVRQPFSWKGVSTNSAVPNYSRPLDGSESYPIGPSFGARPIKHWRKQLSTVHNSSRARAGVGMPMDLPGGSVYLGNTEANTNCTNCVDNLTSNNINGEETTGLKENIVKYDDTNFTTTPADSLYDCVNNKPVCVACNPENNIIRRATTVLSKKYYTDTKGYLQSRCISYNQKLSVNPVPGVQYFNAQHQPLYPTDALDGPQVRATQNCFTNCNTCTGCATCTNCNVGCTDCNNVANCVNCANNNKCTQKPSITIYKPNNAQYAVQGAVSSSARIDRLKYNTITTNGGSFYSAWGSAGANAGRYQGTQDGPYFLKSKYYKCEPAQFHKNGNKRICPPQPFN
uniref:Uncharacterized protein n=1 Tax=viral metagenome TaxID=1070528 RepID=A0A6C0IJQ4_9ZZZZ